ncbi:transcription antitermination protein NusB [Corynebacterium renale]|uniref:transcription antitermination factor NusB n=1 Tax=Corynebacterium renale TaxID=1724 RepID=UPI000DA2E360|nr:transcription antitermination factor NusB [Corynebacterium renale]SQG64768.1 transcription antitermination protein NusB [Corynebacterium renale]STC96202.1 transcription antitermination protein NusB [Corynebacterium renale]
MNQRVNKYRRHGKRFRARLRAVDILFEAETRDVDPMAIIADRVELAVEPDNQVAPIDDYTREIIDGVSVELDNLDDTIEKKLSDSWELDRIPAVDRAILRVSTWELLYNDDVPQKTAVVEGVEMAAHYGGDNASAYINGILDDVSKHREEILVELRRIEEEAAMAEAGLEAPETDQEPETASEPVNDAPVEAPTISIISETDPE